MSNTVQTIQAPTTTGNTIGLMATPAVDLTPTGRLPYLVDQARPDADDLNRAKVIAALPEAVHEALQKAVPDYYTPERADAFAACMVAELGQPGQPADGPLSADQRGPEWMARWGCPEFCVENHGQTGALECHTTALAETKQRITDVDSSGYSEYGETVPWLSAQVVVINDRAQAYGRETRVWLSSGVHLAEISPAKAREALEAMRGFVAQLEAVVDDAERIAADDFAGDPEIARLDTEAANARVKRITEASAAKA